MPVGERIRELRKERGWSQADLGEAVGSDSQRISRYENGRLTPSIGALVRLAEDLLHTEQATLKWPFGLADLLRLV